MPRLHGSGWKSRTTRAAAMAVSASAASLAQADMIAGIADQVSQAGYVHYIENLLYAHDGDRRELPPYNAQHGPCRNNIHDEFVLFGLDTVLEPFPYNLRGVRETFYNVVGAHYGTVTPEVVYVCGAHFDAVWNSPGADDNASGVAAMLEAARVLTRYDFKSTIVFIAFDREEQFMIGSSAWAIEHQYDNVQGALCMDMIAYNETGADRVLTRSWTYLNPFQLDVTHAVNTYSGGLEAVLHEGGWSDHWSFAQVGIPDCGLHAEDDNPFYHSPLDSVDTPDYLDYEYATKVTRGLVAALATAAVPIPNPSDINGDGRVDVQDLLAVISSWGPCADCPADINGDDEVNVQDLMALLSNWD